MKLFNENVEVEINEIGQISSIKYKNIELLHDGGEWWKKTFPIIWPVVGISKGFEVEGINYNIPKHGFMKDLNWDGYSIENEIFLFATFIKNDVYPFSIDIVIKIMLENNKINIKTSFANLSKKTAYFHFGYHPAFKIDNTSIIKGPDTYFIDKNGKLNTNLQKQDVLVNMPFGTKYDTLVNKNLSSNVVQLNYRNLTTEIKSDAPNMQYWKPHDAMFICIEPWWGWNDSEETFHSKAKDKKGIIILESGRNWSATMSINIKE